MTVRVESHLRIDLLASKLPRTDHSARLQSQSRRRCALRDEVNDFFGAQRSREPRRDETAMTRVGNAFETKEHGRASTSQIVDQRCEVEAIERARHVLLDVGGGQYDPFGLETSLARVHLVLDGARRIVGREPEHMPIGNSAPGEFTSQALPVRERVPSPARGTSPSHVQQRVMRAPSSVSKNVSRSEPYTPIVKTVT